MATEIGKDTKVKLSLETIISLGFALVSITAVYFTLKGDIATRRKNITSEILSEHFANFGEQSHFGLLRNAKDVLFKNKFTSNYTFYYKNDQFLPFCYFSFFV